MRNTHKLISIVLFLILCCVITYYEYQRSLWDEQERIYSLQLDKLSDIALSASELLLICEKKNKGSIDDSYCKKTINEFVVAVGISSYFSFKEIVKNKTPKLDESFKKLAHEGILPEEALQYPFANKILHWYAEYFGGEIKTGFSCGDGRGVEVEFTGQEYIEYTNQYSKKWEKPHSDDKQ